ncbi:MAG: hypothetical protein PVH24_00695, partial [Candidatus Zixiibacteriota bacterium]
MRTSLLIIVTLLISFGSASAEDLYEVHLGSARDAEILSSSGADPVHRGTNSYLVLADPTTAQQLVNAGLRVNLVTSDISRDELAIDGRLDGTNAGAFPVLYEKDGFVLLRIDPDQRRSLAVERQIFSVGESQPRIEYFEPSPEVRIGRPSTALDLVSLINQVQQDSLRSYTMALQAFNGRVTGTVNNIYARDWIISKLQSFGYDSVVIDPFTEGDPASTTGPNENVLAYKIGTLLPE